MCGRYLFSTQEYKEFRQIVRDAQRRSSGQHNELNFPMAGDIAPTSEAPVLIASGDKVVAEFQRWGIPGWRGGLMINARAETVCEKPMFRRSMAAQRCVIPASGYYEWDAGKHKYFFQLPGKPIYLAGIYDNIEGVNCFVILTTVPNGTVKDIHDRMPLILTHEQVRPWLTDSQTALQLLTITPPALQRSSEDGQLRFGDLM
ncbi:SOS response-associated peptidase [uncultured Subdoligranulum sp.]|uniref:SOS response-associated peptidase n=1 Tax=uncultured Subdoligranulum sp. TaxID=512298 RepID=UPI0025EBA71B|nr:SOS response-associated peptidase [uncultured Subdoligranulum sp.]